MLGKLLPRQIGFFDYFDQHSALTVDVARELLAMAEGADGLASHVLKIREIEQEADRITHTCVDSLHKTFITPFDRNHIHDLIKRLDDVIDVIDSAATRIQLYDIEVLTPEFKAFAETLLRASQEIHSAVSGLRNLKNLREIEKHCVAIHHLENEGDDILRKALVRLFREETNAVLIIKWKEIYERLEKATDRCEAVANIVQSVLIEAS